MKKLVFILLLIGSAAYADGPIYRFDDPHLNDEVTNVYKDIKYPKVVYAQISSETVTTSSITHLSLGRNGTAAMDAVAFGQLSTITNGSFTPDPSGMGTISNGFGFYQQIGNMVHVWGSYKSGTTTSGNFSLTVPIGSIVYTNRAATNGSTFCGWMHLMFGSRAIASANLGIAFLDGSNATQIFFTAVAPATGTANWPKSIGTSWADNTYYSFDFWYAIS